ncbi:hypothetical protein CK203_040397 [Vitis vinifera]|uniref:Uncharacterized protein n=1 Tax=Vitis vinifera TaxID=29760 RepID=A0A438FX09_VITVI|nr:hypothetical protein CK203_040397 [Vitis vinifera]
MGRRPRRSRLRMVHSMTPTVPPPPPLSQSVPHPAPYILHSQTDATPLPVVAPILASKDAHAHMDRLK